MNRWNGSIRETGGLIAANKTRWFLADFKWNGNDYEDRTIADMPGNITLPDKDRERYTVNREETSSANESLGVWLALDGNQKKQLQVRTRKSRVFEADIRAGKRSKNDALYTFNFNNIFMPSLQYPMIATQFDEDEWEKVIQLALSVTLNKAGMVKTFPLKVLYGSD